MSELDLLGELNRAAGTTGLGFNAVCNALAGTTGLEAVGALNYLAGTTGVELEGVLNRLAGTTGRGADGAARLIGVNLLSTNSATIETSAPLGTAVACTVARSTAQAAQGTASLAMTSTGTGAGAFRMDNAASRVAAVPGVTYTAYGEARAAATPQNTRCLIRFYDSGGTFISGNTSSNTPDTTSGWVAVTSTGVAPAGTAYAAVVPYVPAFTAGSEVHYFDKLGLWVGVRTTWVAP